MTTETDFDALTVKTEQSSGAMEDLNNLYGAAFSLPEWHFIARGEFPNVSPYVASNAAYADSLPTVRAFTDTNRLLRFAKENNLTDAAGAASILTIPTGNIVEYLEQFISQGVYGIWFNSDAGSKGFYVPLKQLRPIKEHLERINWKNSATKSSPAAPVESVSETPATIDRLSTLLEENAELIKAYDEENVMLSAIIGGSAEAMDARPEEEKSEVVSNVAEMLDSVRKEYDMSPGLFKFFIELCLEKRKFITPVLAFALCLREEDKARRLRRDEELAKELAQWIINKLIPNADLLRSPANEPAEPPADEEMDINLHFFQKGEVDFDTSIAPFYETIFPLLENYRGAGGYTDLLSLDAGTMHEKVENIASNAHGACLRIRRFLYPPDGGGTGIGINTIDSNQLRHIQTDSPLLVNFALIKNIAAQTAGFYYRFQGPKGKVFNLTAAIQPLLESCGFKAVSQ